MRRVFAIAGKNLKETWRNLKSSAIIFLLPVVFMAVFAYAFGDTTVTPPISSDEQLQAEIPELGAGTTEITLFQFLAPGLIIYGIIIMVTKVAGDFTNLQEGGYIFRYFTASVTAVEVILGYFIYYVFIGFIQLLILFASAILFGMVARGSIPAAMLVAMPAICFAVGLGLLIGSIVDRRDIAVNIGIMLSIVLGFLSGAFISSTRILWLPTTQAAEGIIRILLYGGSLADVQENILAVCVGSLLTLLAGVVLFHLRRLRYAVA